MAINFPDNPVNGQNETLAGKLYTYNSATTSWLLSTAGSDVATAVATLVDSDYVAARVDAFSVTVLDTAPTSPSNGDQWFNSTDGSLNVYYNDGSSSQWVVVSGPAGPAGAAGSPTSYANLAAFPSSGNTAGDMGFATDTKFSYMWDGAVWQRIAMGLSGNAEPIWTTTPPSTLELANDGSTAVTLAGVAIDEFPVQYSWDGYSGTTLYDSDSLPPQLVSAPTFSGGTASLVGSSTTGNAGSFNFRLKASDGVKTATAITVVSLDFFPPPSGLIAYYDAVDSPSVSVSNSTWSDISGNSGPDLTLSSPIYNSSGIGAEPSLTISNAVYGRAGTTSSSLGSSTTIVAIMQVTMTDDTLGLIIFDDNVSGGTGNGIYAKKDETYHPALNNTAGYRLSVGDNTTANTLFIDKVDMVNTKRADVANKLYVDTGATAKMHSIVLQNTDLSSGFSTQSASRGTSSSYAHLDGQIRALLFYNRTLSSTEVEYIHNHYSAIYGTDMAS